MEEWNDHQPYLLFCILQWPYLDEILGHRRRLQITQAALPIYAIAALSSLSSSEHTLTFTLLVSACSKDPLMVLFVSSCMHPACYL